jgi:hypothetical protein
MSDPTVNLLGLCARWRSGDLREQPLPGVPWLAGEVGDALAPVLRGRESTKGSHVAEVARKAISDPEAMEITEIRLLAAAALSAVESVR